MVSGVSTNPKEALVNELRGEYERTQMRLRELQNLIEQSQAEVKRLQQKSIDVTTQLNRLETNFDTVPRNDIKVIYTNAMDTKTRLLTMQNQLEKVQQDRTQLELFAKTIERYLSMLEGIAASSIIGLPQETTGDDKGEAGKLASTTVVRIVEAQEAERQRLARQMHDGPAQSLTNFILQAEICQRLFDRNPDRATEELNNLKTAASSTFQKVRDFIFDLRPMMLDDLGLVPTVRRYVDAFAEKSNIETRLTVVGEERRRMEPHTEVTMFRGVQELLGYTRDVSNATKIEIMLDVSGNPIKANITFNGNNVDDTETAAEASNGKVFGLRPLRERVELVGGVLNIVGEGGDNRVDIALPAIDN